MNSEGAFSASFSFSFSFSFPLSFSTAWLSLSRWLRVTADLGFLFPLLEPAFDFDSSSDGAWETELLRLERGEGEGELVRWRFAACLFLEKRMPN